MKARFESDHTDSHVLRYRRLRVERQEVLFGDADPLLCRQGDALVLAGRGGSLAHSDDGGVTWSQVADLAAPAAAGGMVLALTADRNGMLVAAIQRSGALMVLGAEEPAGPWRVVATLDVERHDSPRACLTALVDGALLLCLPGPTLRSTDGGETWEPAAQLPAGCGTLHPLQLGSGRLVAPVGGPAGDIALAASEDSGATWNIPEGFAPLGAELAELDDGRLVLSYGMPHFPYGARALIGAPSEGASVTWGEDVHVLGLCRYAIREKARPVLAGAGVSAATAVTADGAIVSAFHRGAALGAYAPPIYGPGMGEGGRRAGLGGVGVGTG
ncbi:MAG: sialidase family protein, partial [Spirochaetaceae bacterium]|nr:sialidase family protein [Spirochaetaceae bacterium]